MVKNKPANVRDIRDVGSIRKIPWRRAWQTTPVFLPGESHGQRRWANFHGVRKSWIQLRQLSMPTFTSFHSYCDIWLAHTLAKYVVVFFLTKKSISESYCEMKNKWIVPFSKLLVRKTVQLSPLFFHNKHHGEHQLRTRRTGKWSCWLSWNPIFSSLWLSSLELRKAIFW